MSIPENLNLSHKHDISDSDSDKTVSEDEMREIMAGGKYGNAKSDHSDNDDATDDTLKVNETSTAGKMNAQAGLNKKPDCKYGDKCYRKNPQHLRDYRHPLKRPQTSTANDAGSAPKKPKFNLGIGFYMTKVRGISSSFNQNDSSIGIKDILSTSVGKLKASAQFNYMFELSWLCAQYPQEFSTKPLLIIHGEQKEAKRNLEQQASRYPHIKLCQAPLAILFGTHHTKMMFLLYEEGLRIVIHTSNLISQDWDQKSQGAWLSKMFPKLDGPPSVLKGDSETFFKRDLLDYLMAYRASQLIEWCDHIKSHDLSSAKVYIIGSVPGRHSGGQKQLFGHLKLRKVLQDKGPEFSEMGKSWPVIGQFSSIGSLGAAPNQWLTKEWLISLSAGRKSPLTNTSNKLQLIFPSVDDVRLSLEGYPAGGSLPYSGKTAQKQPWLRDFLHVWRCGVRGRTHASPHIKTYIRTSPDYTKVAWMLITSANLSKAAWGALEKQDSQLMIRSYELGVLFLPQMFNKTYFDGVPTSSEYPIPFDLPPTCYCKEDQAWMWDVPHTKAPDRNGMMWQPH